MCYVDNPSIGYMGGYQVMQAAVYRDSQCYDAANAAPKYCHHSQPCPAEDTGLAYYLMLHQLGMKTFMTMKYYVVT